MANVSKRTYNKTIEAKNVNGKIVLKYESWKSVSETSTDRESITMTEKTFESIEEMCEFIDHKYKIAPTDQEIVEASLKTIEKAAKKAWYPLQRITKTLKADSPFSVKIYQMVKNAYISYLSRKGGFDFSALLNVPVANLSQYDPEKEEVADLVNA
jgi:hypothetical protein